MNRYPNLTKITQLNHFPEPIIVGNGTCFQGEGPIGNDSRGPTLSFEKDGFIFNGDEDVYNGTGGSVQNLKVFKKLGFTGGTAITLTATGPDRRCGETRLRDLLIYGSGNGSGQRGIWDNGIVVDGSMLTTSGSAGIRTVLIENVRISDCAKSAVNLWNVVHCKIVGLQLDPGQAVSKMEMVGGQNIIASHLIINGTLTVSGGKMIELSGYIDTLVINGNTDGIRIYGEVNNLYVESGVRGVFYGLVNKVKNNKSWGFKIV